MSWPSISTIPISINLAIWLARLGNHVRPTQWLEELKKKKHPARHMRPWRPARRTALQVGSCGYWFWDQIEETHIQIYTVDILGICPWLVYILQNYRSDKQPKTQNGAACHFPHSPSQQVLWRQLWALQGSICTNCGQQLSELMGMESLHLLAVLWTQNFRACAKKRAWNFSPSGNQTRDQQEKLASNKARFVNGSCNLSIQTSVGFRPF